MINRFAPIGVTVCGLILAAVPLALWIAWSPSGFLLVLAAGAASLVLLGVLASHLPPRDDSADERQHDEMKVVLSNEFVEEIHKISPLNYHHSRTEKARFRRAMDRLRQLIR